MIARASCGCLFLVLAVLRGQINLPNEGVVYINPLYPVSTGLVRGMNDHLFHKLPQDGRGQLGRLGVLLHDFQKALDIDGLGLGGVHDDPEVFNRLD